jgi:hypothetical protein
VKVPKEDTYYVEINLIEILSCFASHRRSQWGVDACGVVLAAKLYLGVHLHWELVVWRQTIRTITSQLGCRLAVKNILARHTLKAYSEGMSILNK